jgi:hypothetical protein
LSTIFEKSVCNKVNFFWSTFIWNEVVLTQVWPPVLFTLTQVVLLLLTSTFTRVQIQSNSGTLVIGVCTMWSSLLVVLVGDDDGDNHDDEGSKSG